MTYRSELDALEARHEALAEDVARRTRELEDTKALLDESRAKVRLPILDDIRVAAPCSADWSKMTGDARARHCGDCNKHVYNLSEMTREEAHALLVEKEGTLCVRYYRRNDGTILTADCPVGTKRRRRRRWAAVGAVTMLASAVTGWFVRHPHGDLDRVTDEVSMTLALPVVIPPPPRPPAVDHPELELVMGQTIAPVKHDVAK